jgi:hypothetical protein
MPDDSQTPVDLAAKRAEQAAAEGDEPTGQDGDGGQSIDDLADEQANGDTSGGEEDDGQLFVWEHGRKVTLGTLIARNIPVEHAWVFGGSRRKGRGGLPPLDGDVLLVMRGKPAKVAIVPTRDDDEKVTKVTIEVHLAAKVVEPADSEEALGMLAGVLADSGYQRKQAV